MTMLGRRKHVAIDTTLYHVDLMWGDEATDRDRAIELEQTMIRPAEDASFVPWLPDTRFYRRQIKKLQKAWRMVLVQSRARRSWSWISKSP